jgi:TolB protein
MDADGTDRRRVTADRETQFGPDWSPDGTRIAYTNYDTFGFTSIVTIGTDGSDGLVVFDAGDHAVGSPAYSPDGLWIAFARSNRSGDSSNIWVVGSDGEGAVRATTGRPYDVTPGWQPVTS